MKKLSLLGGCVAILLSINVSAIQEVSSDSALTNIISSNANVVVDFYGTTCPPCRALAPHLDRFATKYPNIKFVKIDAWKVTNLGQKYGFSGVPAVFFFKNGSVMGQVVGNKPSEIEAKIKQIFGC